MGLISPHLLLPEDAIRIFALILYALDAGIVLGVCRFWLTHTPSERPKNYLHALPSVVFQLAVLGHLGLDAFHRIGQRFEWWATPSGIAIAVLLPFGYLGVVRMVRRRDAEHVVIDGEVIRQDPASAGTSPHSS